MIRALLSLIVLALVGLPLHADDWTDEYDKALSRAKKERKHVLVLFTGSDWCGWCIKLEGEVFREAEFRAYAARSWVLVELDYPKRKKVRDWAQNEKLQKQYGVRTFPTLVLLGPDGAEIGRIGYRFGGLALYLRMLRAWTRYSGLKGGLAKALEAAPDEAARHKLRLELVTCASHIGKLTEIPGVVRKVDPDNTRGYLASLAASEAEGMIGKGNAKGALALLTAFMKIHQVGKGEHAQAFYAVLASLYVARKETETALKYFKLAIAAAPKSAVAEQLRKGLDEEK